MKRQYAFACLIIVLTAGSLLAQVTGDVIGIHDLGPGTKSPVVGARPDFCEYCHAPHFGVGGRTPLWNQTLSTQVYAPYTSTTEQNKDVQPTPGADSSLCLSCHDGTVAPGTTAVYGKVTTTGTMYTQDVFGANLQPSHPFSMALPLKDSVDLVASLVAQGKTADPLGVVRLINGNLECTSCHNAHVQAKDLISQNFLVRNSANGAMCLACHDPNRQMSGKVNPLNGWATSIHNIATNRLTPQANVGSYPTVMQSACIGCHAPHNALGAARLLRGINEQDCIACHSGGNNITPAPTSIFAEYTAPKVGHPIPSASNQHDPAEAVLLNNNRHSTCVDCHDVHSANQVKTFPPPPLIRVSQSGVAGISATDGVTVLTPAINQYENCFRCHGTSSGEAANTIFGYLPVRAVSAGNPLNLIPQFSINTPSSHPVTHVRNSPLPQPSLLPNLLNLDGLTQGRAMGTQIFCTDCHNSDDNREFGGAGPNGPHASKWTHILERQYVINQSPGPGQLITNLYPNPDLSVNGPYAMCGKCHDLAGQIIKNTSFTQHAYHINAGFSCSVCHTAHGMGATSATISGQRLVNFDVNVVGQNGATPISYSRTANTCVLACHTAAHNSNGTVTASGAANKVKPGQPPPPRIIK
ncbi:MAG: cytochrome c3 family protein [Candidatus Sulfotelmatobacter sp.]